MNEPNNTANPLALTTAVVDGLSAKGVMLTAELRILLLLSDKPEGLTLAQIVKAREIPFSTASRVVWHLSDDNEQGLGLVTYKAHATDRRKKLVVLTPAALKVLRPAAAKITLAKAS